MESNNNSNLSEELLGVVIESSDEIDKENYIKLDKNSFDQFNMMLQNFPQMAFDAYKSHKYKGAYRVIFDKGLGELQRVADSPGFFRGALVAPGTNNKIVGGAILQPLTMSTTEQALSLSLGLFNVASMVTGQYFLANINSELKDLNTKVSEILQYMEEDKKSKSIAEQNALRSYLSRIPYLERNEIYRQSVLTSVIDIKKNAEARIINLRKQLDTLVHSFDSKDSFEKIRKNFNTIYDQLVGYLFSVISYELSCFLEVKLSGCKDNDFYSLVLEEVDQVVSLFNSDFEHYSKDLSRYISKLKKLQQSDVRYGELARLGMNIPKIGWLLAIAGAGLEIRRVSENDKADRNKKEALEKYKNILNDVELRKDQLNLPRKLIENERIINCSKVEFLIEDDELFISKDTYENLSLSLKN